MPPEGSHVGFRQEQASRINETGPLPRGWTLLSWAGTLARSLIELE